MISIVIIINTSSVTITVTITFIISIVVTHISTHTYITITKITIAHAQNRYYFQLKNGKVKTSCNEQFFGRNMFL